MVSGELMNHFNYRKC